MSTVLAVIRSLFLLFVTGYAARGVWVLNFHVPRTFDEQYSMCASNLSIMQRALGLAAGWILLEVAIGWAQVWRRRRADAPRPGPSAPVAG